MERDLSVPPKPLVRVRSGRAEIVFTFDWGEEYGWVMELNKGDPVKANCEIANIGDSFWAPNVITPSLRECRAID